jgi:hypothetical protein
MSPWTAVLQWGTTRRIPLQKRALSKMTLASSSTISQMHCWLLFLDEFPTVRHRYNTNPYHSEDAFCTCVAFSRSCEGVAYMISNTQYRSNHIHIHILCLLTFRLLRLYS